MIASGEDAAMAMFLCGLGMGMSGVCLVVAAMIKAGWLIEKDWTREQANRGE